eukprot:scaffold1311_cov99-Cylindrotheca_fusiformis.AAC.13
MYHHMHPPFHGHHGPTSPSPHHRNHHYLNPFFFGSPNEEEEADDDNDKNEGARGGVDKNEESTGFPHTVLFHHPFPHPHHPFMMMMGHSPPPPFMFPHHHGGFGRGRGRWGPGGGGGGPGPHWHRHHRHHGRHCGGAGKKGKRCGRGGGFGRGPPFRLARKLMMLSMLEQQEQQMMMQDEEVEMEQEETNLMSDYYYDVPQDVHKKEKDTAITMSVDIVGFDPNELNLKLEPNGILTLSGTRTNRLGENFVLKRQIVPNDDNDESFWDGSLYQLDAIQARTENDGILEIIIPKKERADVLGTNNIIPIRTATANTTTTTTDTATATALEALGGMTIEESSNNTTTAAAAMNEDDTVATSNSDEDDTPKMIKDNKVGEDQSWEDVHEEVA